MGYWFDARFLKHKPSQLAGQNHCSVPSIPSYNLIIMNNYFLPTVCSLVSVDSLMCMLIQRNDTKTSTLRWSLPAQKRCSCIAVAMRRTPLDFNSCPADKSREVRKGSEVEEELWFTDDPKPLTQRWNWTPEKLNELLERESDCAGKWYLRVGCGELVYFVNIGFEPHHIPQVGYKCYMSSSLMLVYSYIYQKKIKISTNISTTIK